MLDMVLNNYMEVLEDDKPDVAEDVKDGCKLVADKFGININDLAKETND